MKCIVHGCHNKLDDTGFPVKYCDYQQGRCPMQRPNRDVPQWVIAAIIVTGLLMAIAASLWIK